VDSEHDDYLANRDPGLQPERTVMAWRRTELSMAALSALLLKDVRAFAPAAVIGAVGLVVTFGLVIHTERRHEGTNVRPLRLAYLVTMALTLAAAVEVAWLFVKS
jgi:uncharacterized membrane protein YidH (DUF202 family)